MILNNLYPSPYSNKVLKRIRVNMINTQAVALNCVKCESYQTCKTINLIRVVQYIQINSYDLVFLSVQYKKCKCTWDKILLSRILATYLYDIFQNISKVFRIDKISYSSEVEDQEDFFEELKKDKNLYNQFVADRQIISDLKKVLKTFSKKKNEIESHLAKIRNLTLAHKEINGANLFTEIETINHETIYSYTLEIIPDITAVTTCLQNLLNIHLKLFLK